MNVLPLGGFTLPSPSPQSLPDGPPPQRPTLSRRRPVGYGTLTGRSTRQEPIEPHLGGLPKSGFSSKRWPSSPRELRSELKRKMRTKRRLKRCLVALRAQKSLFYRGESKRRAKRVFQNLEFLRSDLAENGLACEFQRKSC